MARTVRKQQRRAGTVDVYAGQRIREARMAARMSQEDLGNKLDVSFQQIQKYEKGTNRVSVGRIQQIAEALGKPVSFFLNHSDDVHTKADPNLTRMLTSKEGYEIASCWFAMSANSRKAALGMVRCLAKEGA